MGRIHRYPVAKLWDKLDASSHPGSLFIKPVPDTLQHRDNLNATVRLKAHAQHNLTRDAR